MCFFTICILFQVDNFDTFAIVWIVLLAVSIQYFNIMTPNFFRLFFIRTLLCLNVGLFFHSTIAMAITTSRIDIYMFVIFVLPPPCQPVNIHRNTIDIVPLNIVPREVSLSSVTIYLPKLYLRCLHHCRIHFPNKVTSCFLLCRLAPCASSNNGRLSPMASITVV